MAIRQMVHCRKCNREFDWNNDEGYAKMPDGSYLCSIFCQLREVEDRLTIAMQTLEFADDILCQVYFDDDEPGVKWCEVCHRPVRDDGKLTHKGNCEVPEYLELRKKLEAMK